MNNVKPHTRIIPKVIYNTSSTYFITYRHIHKIKEKIEMEDIFLALGLLIAVTISLSLYRAVLGPGVFNQVAAVNVIGTKVIVLLVAVGYIFDRPMFVDISLLYAILNFIATLVMSKYLERGEICSA